MAGPDGNANVWAIVTTIFSQYYKEKLRILPQFKLYLMRRVLAAGGLHSHTSGKGSAGASLGAVKIGDTAHCLRQHIHHFHRELSAYSSSRNPLLAIRCPVIDGSIEDVSVSTFPDTGSCIKQSLVIRHNIRVHRTRTRSIRLPTGNSLKTVGTAIAKFKFRGEETAHTLTFDVDRKSVWEVVLRKGFLEQTKALTQFRSRIRDNLRPCVRS